MFQVGQALSSPMPSGSEPLTESGLPTRSKTKHKRPRSIVDVMSPIAADGGFGQMESDDSEERENSTPSDPKSEEVHNEFTDNDKGFGDDFDDFEVGAADEDFGDFDEGEEPEPVVAAAPSIQSLPPTESPFVSYLPRNSATIQIFDPTICKPNSKY